MNVSLLRKLIQNNIVKTGTEVTATYTALDISGMARHRFNGSFFVVSAEDRGESILFTLASTTDGYRHVIPSTDIYTLDGMEPARLAAIYNIREDGSDIKVGNRRGRKPKIRVSESSNG
jgi:hypothetical protein